MGFRFWRGFALAVARPILAVTVRHDWSGTANVPAEGGVIVVANHLSEVDPFVVGHYLNDGAGRWAQFLAKSSLFGIAGIGHLLRQTRQIPVVRGSADAARALDAAADALRAGQTVVIYPEGTTPKSGELWPERGKTGAARLFLTTGAPVIPLVTWGPQRIFDPRTHRLRLRPRTPVTVVAGPPIDLSSWAGSEPTSESLTAITEKIMGVLREMLAQVRGEPVPSRPVDGTLA